MPYKRKYNTKKKKTNASKYKKRRYNTKKKVMYKKKKPDTGTYLKLSSQAVPVVINNLSTPSSGFSLTPDTFQSALRFTLDSASGPTDPEKIIIQNQSNPALEGDQFPVSLLQLGSPAETQKYFSLYKYYQVYKIVVKFYPSITEGGVLSSDPTTTVDFGNAISGQITTDLSRNKVANLQFGTPFPEYYKEYPATLDGQVKAMSRKISRNHNIYKPWTRTFVPSKPIENQSNPRSEYQYRPQFLTEASDILQPREDDLGDQTFIMRMKNLQQSGFLSDTLDGTAITYPATDTFVRYGTLTATAYVKFIQPFN